MQCPPPPRSGTRHPPFRRYLCLPSLDCNLPTAEQLLDAAHEVRRPPPPPRLPAPALHPPPLNVQIATWRHSVYIHCANGHGRSTSLAALVLVYRGQFRTWREAFAHIQRSRLLAKIHVNQEKVMDTAQQLLDAADASDEEPTRSGTSPGPTADAADSIVRRASSVQRRPFKFVRAASDGGFMEVKPSAPQDAAIVHHYKRTGRAIASRSELSGELQATAGAPKAPPSTMAGGGPAPLATAGALADMDAATSSASPLAAQPNALRAASPGGGDGAHPEPPLTATGSQAVDAADIAVVAVPEEE